MDRICTENSCPMNILDGNHDKNKHPCRHFTINIYVYIELNVNTGKFQNNHENEDCEKRIGVTKVTLCH